MVGSPLEGNSSAVVGGPSTPVSGKSYAEIICSSQIKVGDVVWIQTVEAEVSRKSEALRLCLVGRWDDFLDAPSLKRWAIDSWCLEGNIRLVQLVFGFEVALGIEKKLF